MIEPLPKESDSMLRLGGASCCGIFDLIDHDQASQSDLWGFRTRLWKRGRVGDDGDAKVDHKSFEEYLADVAIVGSDDHRHWAQDQQDHTSPNSWRSRL